MTNDVEHAGRVTCPFDHHSPSYGTEFRSVLEGLRQVAPIVWSESYGGFWVATSYATVRRIAIDTKSFTVAPGPDRTGGLRIPTPPGLKTRALFVPGETDGEEHDGYRTALNPHFSKARVAEIEPMINAHVARAFDRVESMREFDVVEDLIVPILCGIACEHLGLKADDPATLFKDLHRMVSSTPGTDAEFQPIRRAFEVAWAQLVDAVKERRLHPEDDVISHLVTNEHPVFSDEQVQMMTLNVILGALHTTSSLLAQMIIHLDGDVGLRDQLRAEPALLPKAVDEFLRLKAVTISLARTATRDVEVDGAKIKQGDRVLICFAGANYDPEKYPRPEEFDLQRGSAQQLGLGVGAHFCLGAWLAKSIAAMTLREMLERMSYIAVDHTGIVVSPEVSNAYSIEHVPGTVVPFSPDRSRG